MIKKFLSILFAMKLIAIAFFSLAVISLSNINSVLFTNNSELLINFDGEPGLYYLFLAHLENEGIDVARYVYTSDYDLNIYTSDLSLRGMLPVRRGVSYYMNTDGLLGNLRSFIYNLIPSVNIEVVDIYSSRNFSHDGKYYISLTDLDKLESLINILSDEISSIVLLQVNLPSIQSKMFVFMYLLNFLVMLILISLCVLATLIQYSIQQLKPSTVLLLHGYSAFKLTKYITNKIVKVLMVSFIFAYAIFFCF